MSLPLLPSIATGLALLLFAVTGANVSRARGRFGIEAPATAGHPDFERVFRAHQNTLEALALFVPALWLFAAFVSPFWGGIVGLVWVVGRVLYAWGYYRGAGRREPGFVIGAVCSVILLLGALLGMLLYR